MHSLLLHAAGSGGAVPMMAAKPLLAGLAGVLLAAVAVRLGLRASLTATAAGLLLLVSGLTADFTVHDDQAAERRQLMTVLPVSHDPRVAARLHELEDAETANPWHAVAAAGQGLLIGGLAGMCLILWLRQRNAESVDLVLKRLDPRMPHGPPPVPVPPVSRRLSGG